MKALWDQECLIALDYLHTSPETTSYPSELGERPASAIPDGMGTNYKEGEPTEDTPRRGERQSS